MPKRAGDEPLTRTTLRFQSDSQLGGALDFGRRYGPDGAFGVRVNVAGSDGDLPVDPVSDDHLLGAIACGSAWNVDPARCGIGVQN